MTFLKKPLFLLALLAAVLAVTAVAVATGESALSVSRILAGEGEGTVLVEGVYAGVADEGAGLQKEVVLKDADGDGLICLQDVPYGASPDHGYDRGDLVRLYASVERRTFSADGENKVLLHFAEGNPGTAEETVVSKGHSTALSLENAVSVQNWTQMKAIFNAETLSPYTLVHFKGKFYFNEYAANSDSIPIYRFHMNASASNLKTIKPDGTRALGLRHNMLEENVPAALSVYFNRVIGHDSYPGTSGTFDFYAVVTGVNSVNFQLTILDPSWLLGLDAPVETQTQVDIIREVAEAYYRRGGMITYDQRYRRLNTTPEEVTRQAVSYLDCSSFVNSVYYEAFGENVLGVPVTETNANTANYAAFAKENIGVLPEVAGYWEPIQYTTEEERAAAIEEIRGTLQPGDILIYRHGKSSDSNGHAMLYVGDGMFMHSTGSTTLYNASTPETSHNDRAGMVEMTTGTILKQGWSILFDNKSARYLMKNDSSDVIRSVAILRPLARGLTPTDKTLHRMEIAGLALKKTVEPGISSAVEKGETVAFTLTVENHSSRAFTDLLLEDLLPEGLTFVSGNRDFAAEGNALSCRFSVGAFETLKIRWSARVASETPAGTRLLCAGTRVSGMDLPALTLTVRGLSDEDLARVAEKALEDARNGKTVSDPLIFAKDLYRDTLGVAFADGFDSSAQLFDDFFAAVGSEYVWNEESALSGVLVPKLYSGTLIHRHAEIFAVWFEENFMPGDLIFCETKGAFCLYVYVGDGTLVRVRTNEAAAEVQNGEERRIRKTVSGTTTYSLNTVLSAVRSYERCAVFRPSTLAEPQSLPIAGDLNRDGAVTDADAVYLLYHTFYPEEYPVDQNGDFNGDGQLTDADAVYLLYFTFI